MTKLPLYPDRTLPLFPDLRTPLHALATVADLLVVQVRWDHQTYAGLTFHSPRLHPTYLRLRSPQGGPLPGLVAITGVEPPHHTESETSYSPIYGQVTRTREYSRYRLATFDPETGEAGSPFGRWLPAGGGFLYAHGMELNQATLYETNADDWYATQGTLTIAINGCATRDPWLEGWFPRLDLAPFAYLRATDPPFPTQAEVLEGLSDPAPLASGPHAIELAYPRVNFNIGRRLERSWLEIEGVAHLELNCWAAANVPPGMVADWRFPRVLREVLANGLGAGTIPARDHTRTLTLDFGG
ncbi:MAG TPA: hypothetical protein VEI97_12460 [bacterium]|nr:hypothetical protein [bacterium]